MLLDIKGEEVNVGDRVLCVKYSKTISLGVFEKVTPTSYLIRLKNKSALSIPREIWIRDPTIGYAWQQVPNDKPTKSILKVDSNFSL